MRSIDRRSASSSSIPRLRNSSLSSWRSASGLSASALALDADLVLVELLLRAHRQVLAGAHGEGARDESGESGESHDVVTGIRAGEAQNERDVGHQSVEEAKERRSKTPVADLAVVRLAGVALTQGVYEEPRRRGR